MLPTVHILLHSVLHGIGISLGLAALRSGTRFDVILISKLPATHLCLNAARRAKRGSKRGSKRYGWSMSFCLAAWSTRRNAAQLCVIASFHYIALAACGPGHLHPIQEGEWSVAA